MPTLDGGKVTLKIPAGTRSGQTFRVRRRGIQAKRGVGDLLVSVEVDVPANPTVAEREAVKALAEAMAGSDSPDGRGDAGSAQATEVS